MTEIRAALFDLGGTLYDYQTLEEGNRKGLLALARWAGSGAAPETVVQTHLESLREVFYEYLPKPYYLHHDLFRDALHGMARRLEVSLDEKILARYEDHQRELRNRDFVLREGAAPPSVVAAGGPTTRPDGHRIPRAHHVPKCNRRAKAGR